MTSSLYLSDIIKRNNLVPEKVKLIRHSLNDCEFKKCYESGFLESYQQIQGKPVFDNTEYVLSFIGGVGTSAKFYGCYKIIEGKIAEKSLMPEGFPFEGMFDGKNYYYHLEPTLILNDFRERLIIDWGRGTLAWCQKATNDKPVLAIQENQKFAFSGYENVILGYNELKEIVDDPVRYENWHTALSSIYAIYLIVDTSDGKQYVGSAYGEKGLLQRWKYYGDTNHGDNIKIKELLAKYPNRCENFQFSILQVLPKTITDVEVIKIESLYKRKLQSIKCGLNNN